MRLVFSTDNFYVDDTNNRTYFGATATTAVNGQNYKRQLTYSSNYCDAIISTSGGVLGVVEAIWNDSVSPATNDEIWRKSIFGNSSTGVIKEFGRISVIAKDVTNGGEDGSMDFYIMGDNNGGGGGDLIKMFSLQGELDRFEFLGYDQGGGGVEFYCYNNSSTPNVGDDILTINAYGNNSAAVVTQYGRMMFSIDDETSASEDASFAIALQIASSLNTRLLLDSDGCTVDHSTSVDPANCVITTGGLIQRNASSARYKENIEDLEFSTNILRKLRPRSYVGKREQKKAIGLIAEEVSEIYPMFASYDAEGRPEGVHYSLIPIGLLFGWKEHECKIAELEAKIQILESRL
jgi:hypothetical protein